MLTYPLSAPSFLPHASYTEAMESQSKRDWFGDCVLWLFVAMFGGIIAFNLTGSKWVGVATAIFIGVLCVLGVLALVFRTLALLGEISGIYKKR